MQDLGTDGDVGGGGGDMDRSIYWRSPDGDQALYLDDMQSTIENGHLTGGTVDLTKTFGPTQLFRHVVIADSGFGCVKLIVCGT